MGVDPLLRVEGLVAGYDGVPVVHGVDLLVRPGEVVALLGPNGAGKTTTLLTISGVLAPLGGCIELFGEQLRAGARRVRPAEVTRRAKAGLAHVPEDRGLFLDLTVAENLRVGRRRSRRGRPSSRAARAGVGATASDGRAGPGGGEGDDAPPLDVLELFPALGALLDRRAGLLSGGEQQMLALARALVGRPRLLMVDEMSLGLAPIIVQQLLPVLRAVADRTGAGVLVVEQHVPLVLSIADRAAVLTRGRVTAMGTAAELAQRPELIEAGYFGATAAP
jgi:branched-chain amino acid transport system ATP-binding protein